MPKLDSVRETGIKISLSSLASLVVLIPALWFIARPILISSVSTALAQDIQGAVQEGVKPLKSGFRVLLLRDISDLRKKIAAMKLRERNDPNWSEADAETLVDLQLDLESVQMAYDALDED